MLEQGDVYPGSYQVGSTFNGPTSDAGIRIKAIDGKSVQAVSHGYQLFDASRLPSITNGGITFTNIGNGAFKVSGNLTEGAFNNSVRLSHQESIELVKPGPVLSVKNGKSPYAYFTIYRNNTNTGRETNTYERSNCIITQEDLEDPTFQISIGFYGQFGAWNLDNEYKPMFYQDGDGTYEPYTGGKPGPQSEYPIPIESVEISKLSSDQGEETLTNPIVLRSLPDGTQDEYKDGKIIRRVGSITLDGSSDEQWTVLGMLNGYTRALFICPGGEVLQLSLDKVMQCNRLPTSSTITPWNDLVGDCLYPVSSNTPGNTGLILEGEYTIAELRAWLQAHPLVVHYKLGEPAIGAVPKLPILPSSTPKTEAWSDSSLRPTITWEALPAGSCALEVQELRKRIEELEKESVESA